jgi:calcineurin-like phosphoesterase family protein
MERPVRLLHTSDVHLGCDYLAPDLAERGWRAIVDAAVASRADVLLVAGDLFDHNRVPDELVRLVLTELERFSGHVAILPGNHDCYDERSVYRRPAFASAPSAVHLIGADAGETTPIPELGLELWGRAVIDHTRDFRPLRSVPPRQGVGWRVGMAHGHLESADELRSSPISPGEIGAADCDYVALGHWDRWADVSHGGVAAFYSGAPHGPVSDGRCLLVTLRRGDPASVERLALGVAPTS